MISKATTPDIVRQNWTAMRQYDASDLLTSIRCPTLVLYPRGREGGYFVKAEAVRTLAAHIPGARLQTVGGPYTQFGGALEAIDAALQFIAEDMPESTAQEAGSGMTAILFADIVDSSALTERMGDAAFRAKAGDLDASLRAIITETGGSVIDAKTLGDGVLATFPAASQAIDAAMRCGAAGSHLGLPLHLGLHAGDVIREANNVFGGAVNIAARISALSAAGEVLVSRTVRDLARTSAGVVFEDRGEHALKGIAEAVRVFAVLAQEQTP